MSDSVFLEKGGQRGPTSSQGQATQAALETHPEGNATAPKERDVPDSAFCGAMGPVWKTERKRQNEQLGDQGETTNTVQTEHERGFGPSSDGG